MVINLDRSAAVIGLLKQCYRKCIDNSVGARNFAR